MSFNSQEGSKTIPFDVIASFLIGLIVPALTPERTRAAGASALSQPVTGVFLYELLFFIPLGAYLYYFYPDWSLMYFIDPALLDYGTRVNLGFFALAAYLLAAVGGASLSTALVRAQKIWPLIGIIAGLATGLGLLSFLTMDRLSGVGLYSEWIAEPRVTIPLIQHKLALIIGADALAGGAALFTLVLGLRKPVPVRPSRPGRSL